MAMFIIADETNLAHRAYHALKNTPDGIPVSASGVPIASCSSVMRSLLALLKQYHATHLAVIFDNNEKTFRHTLYPDYKAGRTEKDASLITDIRVLQELLIAAGIGIIAPTGYEADDVIATLTTLAGGQPVLIYSGDRDLWQLVNDTTSVLCPSKGRITPADVNAILGVRADQVADYKALKGDSADNIPGIRGMGAKMATGVLSQYDTLEAFYATRISVITGRPYTLLKLGEADARLSKQLAVLVNTLSLGCSLDALAIEQIHLNRMLEKLRDLGLSGIAKGYESQFGGDVP
jgi:DNA polymerase I